MVVNTHGGARSGAGRRKGSISQTTAELRATASEFTQSALNALVQVMNDKEAPPAARIQAAGMILERAAGKAQAFEDIQKAETITNMRGRKT